MHLCQIKKKNIWLLSSSNSYRIEGYLKYEYVKGLCQLGQIVVLLAPLELACTEGEKGSGYQVSSCQHLIYETNTVTKCAQVKYSVLYFAEYLLVWCTKTMSTACSVLYFAEINMVTKCAHVLLIYFFCRIALRWSARFGLCFN